MRKMQKNMIWDEKIRRCIILVSLNQNVPDGCVRLWYLCLSLSIGTLDESVSNIYIYTHLCYIISVTIATCNLASRRVYIVLHFNQYNVFNLMLFECRQTLAFMAITVYYECCYIRVFCSVFDSFIENIMCLFCYIRVWNLTHVLQYLKNIFIKKKDSI